MNFDWEAFGKEKIAVHCKTEREAEDFCKRAEEKGFDWISGERRSNNTHFHSYIGETAYVCRSFSSVSYYKAQDYKILEWSDYMGFTKADLKDGMVCIMRDREKYLIVNGILMREDGTRHAGRADRLLRDDLTCEYDKCYDIVRVCASSSCILDDYCKDEYLTEIWHREEPTEMTLSEICAALGKTVKIVKEH